MRTGVPLPKVRQLHSVAPTTETFESSIVPRQKWAPASAQREFSASSWLTSRSRTHGRGLDSEAGHRPDCRCGRYSSRPSPGRPPAWPPSVTPGSPVPTRSLAIPGRPGNLLHPRRRQWCASGPAARGLRARADRRLSRDVPAGSVGLDSAGGCLPAFGGGQAVGERAEQIGDMLGCAVGGGPAQPVLIASQDTLRPGPSADLLLVAVDPLVTVALGCRQPGQILGWLRLDFES